MKYYTGYQYLTTTGNIFNCICARGEYAVMQSEEDPDVVIRFDENGNSPYSDYLILGEVPATGIPNYVAGYRPLDDEDCKVLKIEEGVSLFDDPERRFFIDSNNAGKHWYHCNLNHTVLKRNM
jgi:hypothetical protein